VYDVLTLYLANEMGYDVLTPSKYERLAQIPVAVTKGSYAVDLSIYGYKKDAISQKRKRRARGFAL